MLVIPMYRKTYDSPFLLCNFKGIGVSMFIGNHKFYWDLVNVSVDVLSSYRVTKE